jgi:hypothetical protein
VGHTGICACSEADELLQDYPSSSPAALAASLTGSSSGYEGDPEFVRDIVKDLLKRAAAGLRFWPEHLDLRPLGQEVRQRELACSELARDEPAGRDYAEFWWQKISAMRAGLLVGGCARSQASVRGSPHEPSDAGTDAGRILARCPFPGLAT